MSSVPGLCLISAFSVKVFSEVLPDTPEEMDPQFILFTRNMMNAPRSLNFSDVSTLSHFDSSKSTFIIVHGFRSSGDAGWIENMRLSLLNQVLNKMY